MDEFIEKLKQELKKGVKTVIKLDKNFHIYIHGSSDKITLGKDKKGSYVKLYYTEIRE